MTTHNPNAPPLAHTSLDDLFAQNQQSVNVILNYEGPQIDLDQEEEVEGRIYEKLITANKLLNYTNFTLPALQDLYRDMLPFIADAGVRGPKCKSSYMDQVVCYLV